MTEIGCSVRLLRRHEQVPMPADVGTVCGLVVASNHRSAFFRRSPRISRVSMRLGRVKGDACAIA
jgi:hypothetical protein